MEWFNFDKIKDFFYKVTEVLALFVAVAVLVGIIFGPETAFFGDVVKNFSNILNVLGQEGLLALISILIIVAILKRKLKITFLKLYLYIFQKGNTPKLKLVQLRKFPRQKKRHEKY